MAKKIKGGYYIKARCVQNSAISGAPPHIREIWDWILNNANYKKSGSLERGQMYCSYSDIIEGLKWYVGYRKMTYKKHHCETAMKYYTKAAMVTTMKTARGMVVTICNYSFYQNPDNYEILHESECEKPTRTTREPHLSIIEESKKERKKEYICPKKSKGDDLMGSKKYIPKKYPVIAYWQNGEINNNLIHHVVITDKFCDVEKLRVGEGYTVTVLKDCIDAYNTVLGSEKYWYTYKHSFTEFFREGIKKDPPFLKFLPESKPLENLSRKTISNQNHDDNNPNELAI